MDPKEEAPAAPVLRIGWNLPGTFTRLALHLGVILAWVRAGLPLPQLVVATSAGSIIAACCISFERKVLHRTAKIVANLRRQQIYRLSDGLKRSGMHLIAAPCALVVAYLLTRIFEGSWSLLVLLIGLGAFVWLIRRGYQIFLGCGSPLDNTPLRELLLEQNVAATAFTAKAELRVLACDVAEPGIIVYSNHAPHMSDPQNPLLCERFVDGILGSSALPGRFPLRVVDGKIPRDGEVWTDFPIHQFKGEVDIVFRFDYWEPLQPALAPRHWLADMFRSFDVLRDKNTRDKLKKYELEREHNATLPPEQQSNLPRVVLIRAGEKQLRSIPDLAIYDFKPGQLWRSVRLGYRIVRENLPLIRRELGIPESQNAPEPEGTRESV